VRAISDYIQIHLREALPIYISAVVGEQREATCILYILIPKTNKKSSKLIVDA